MTQFADVRLPFVAFALGLITLAAPADAASHDLATFIREQDLNKDGRVTKEEYAADRAREFARMDANEDGALSRDEYVSDFRRRLEARLATMPAADREGERSRQMKQADVRFGVLDSDGSGSISPAEFDYSGWSMFLHHDTNRDGVVSIDDKPGDGPN